MNITFLLILLVSVSVVQCEDCFKDACGAGRGLDCCPGFQCVSTNSRSITGTTMRCESSANSLSQSWHRIVTAVFMSVLSAYVGMRSG